MFKTKKATRDEIDEAIRQLVYKMSLEEADSDEYRKIAENIRILEEAKANDKPWISGDTMLGSIVHIGGIILILNYEQLGVVTSKALSLLPKLRL